MEYFLIARIEQLYGKDGYVRIKSFSDFPATPKGRREIAAKSGIGGRLILEWVNLADLYCIKGVGSEYSDLLEEAGVDTIVELAKRDPRKLYEKMLAANQKKNLVNQMPARKQVAKWVAQAKKLPRIVKY